MARSKLMLDREDKEKKSAKSKNLMENLGLHKQSQDGQVLAQNASEFRPSVFGKPGAIRRITQNCASQPVTNLSTDQGIEQPDMHCWVHFPNSLSF